MVLTLDPNMANMDRNRFGEGDIDLERLLSNKDEPELDNFLSRVGEISKIISGLASEDQKDQERAIRQADILLHDGSGEGTFGDGDYRIKADRTLINKAKPATEEGGMPQEAFMKMVEKDASERAQDRKERKKRSDEYRTKGNLAFKKENFAEALDNYNKVRTRKPCLMMIMQIAWVLKSILPIGHQPHQRQSLPLHKPCLDLHPDWNPFQGN